MRRVITVSGRVLAVLMSVSIVGVSLRSPKANRWTGLSPAQRFTLFRFRVLKKRLRLFITGWVMSQYPYTCYLGVV